MGPDEIAKLITEDPDVMENLKAVDLGPSKAAQSRKRKRRLEKMKARNQKTRDFEDDKDQYAVDKISGQPKSGQILYSDVFGDEPGGITEGVLPDKYQSTINQAIKGAGRAMRNLMNSPWERGDTQSFRANVKFLGNMKTEGDRIASVLRQSGYTHARTEAGKGSICRFLLDLEKVSAEFEDAKIAAASKGPSPIAFPRGEWWGQFNWTSAASRKKYLDIFSGEIMVRFLGMVELSRDKHAESCNNSECQRMNHADWVARNILCNGGENGEVSLWRVFQHFNRERSDIINTKKPSAKKKKRQADYGEAPGDPLHSKLVNFERALLDKFGKRYISSGMPRVPLIVPRGVDLKDYARQYLQIAHVYFGDDTDIDKMWRQTK